MLQPSLWLQLKKYRTACIGIELFQFPQPAYTKFSCHGNTITSKCDDIIVTSHKNVP